MTRTASTVRPVNCPAAETSRSAPPLLSVVGGAASATEQAMQTAITQNNAVERTLIEQSLDAVNKLSGSMAAVQKNTQDLSAASGARLDTMGTQVQGLSDNVSDLQARMGKLDQKLTDIQNTLQNVDSKMASPPPPAAVPSATADRKSVV